MKALKLFAAVAAVCGMTASADVITWHYDDSTKTIASSDGLWELNVTRSGTNLTIGGYGCPKVPDADHRPAVLDLRTSITDDDGTTYVVTACASHAFDASDYQSAKDCWTDTLSELYLPGTLTSFGDCCVRNNSTLTKFVIDEPASMTSYPVMMGLPNLTIVSPLLPPNVTRFDYSSFKGSKLVGDMVVGHPGATVSISGETLQRVTTLTSMELNCDKVAFSSWCMEFFSTPTVRFRSAYPTDFGNAAFNGMSAKTCRFLIPKGDTTWDGRAVALADGDLAKYESIFGTDAPKPTGLITLGHSSQQFCVPYVDFVNTQSNAFAIAADPEPIAGAVPAYGFTRHGRESVECSATGGTSASGEVMTCLGYTLETLGDDGEWANAEFHEGMSVTVDLSDHVTRRLTWKYGVAGKSLTVHAPTIPFPTDPIGRVDLDPLPTVGETGYAPGTEVTLTAVPAPGCTFVRWHGDVPAGHEYDTSFKVVMDQGLDITPEFHTSRWIYTPSTQMLTDGTWGMKATANGTKLTISSRNNYTVIPTCPTYLDLGAPVTDASGETSYSIVALAGNAIDGGDNFTKIRYAIGRMRFPSTLTSIGDWSLRYLYSLTNLVFQTPCSVTRLPESSFDGCSALTSVEPFLPESISTVWGFSLAPVTNNLTLGKKGGSLTIGGTATFKGLASPVITIKSKTVAMTGAWMFEALKARPCEIWYWCDYFTNNNDGQFYDVPADAIRIHVPASNPTWQAALANSAIVKPWDPSMKTAFEKYFPGQKHPKGRLIGTKPKSAWIDTFGSGMKLIFK